MTNPVPRFWVELLGWPRVFFEEAGTRTPVRLPGNKPQAVLYYLLLTPGPISRETLMALFWPESVSHRARASLRNALYQLQKALPPGALQVDRYTVALSPRYVWDVDVHRLEHILAGHPTLQQLQEAIALYRGDFLEGFYVPEAPAFSHWHTMVGQRLRTRLMEALDRGIRAALQRGHWAVAEDLLAFAVAREPWREDFHYGLLQVLMWQGKYTAALKQYHRCCQILQAELQTEPGPELQRLIQEIRRRQQQPPRFDVPDPPLPVVGRQTDLEALTALLQEARLITLVGPNGVGKTMLALALAHHHRRRFAHGVVFISLEEAQEPAGMSYLVAARLGLSPHTPASEMQYRLLEYLQDRDMLLILDNVEHPAKAAALVASWLQAADRVRVLVTAREPLGIRHERVYAVRPLAYPEEIQAPPPETYPAGQLLLVLWERFVPLPPPRPQDAVWIARLCRLLDGLPLALELAAIQLRQYPLPQLVTTLEQTLDVLQAAWPAAPTRHRSLRLLFQHLWTGLQPSEQDALTQLSVFAGPFTQEEARAITGLSPEALHRLTTRGLVQPVLYWPAGLTLHRVVRAYLQERVRNGAHPHDARHARYYLAWLGRFSQALSREDRVAIYRRKANLRKAWLWAARHRAWSLLAQALGPWHAFHEVHGLYEEGARIFQETLTLLQGESHPLMGHLYARAAALYFRKAALQQALTLAQKAVTLLQGDERGRLFALNILGVAHLHRGEFEQSIRVLEEAVEAARAAREAHERIKGLINLSSAYLRTGRYKEVRPLLEQGRILCQKEGGREGLAFFLLHLGTLALLEQRWHEGETHLQAALDAARDLGRPYFEMHALVGLATSWALQNAAPERIVQAATRAAHLAQSMGDPVTEARALSWLAWARHRMGMSEQAWQILARALKRVNHIAKPTQMHLMTVAAYMWLRQGRPDRAAPLAAYVALHPATEAPTRERARQLLALLQLPLPEHLPSPPPVLP